MEQSFTIRVPRSLVYVLAAVVLIGGGIGAGLVLGGNGDASVASVQRSSTSTSSAPSTTTSTTTAFAGFPGANDDGGGGASNGGGGNNGGGGDAADAADPAPPAPPAATAEVSKTGPVTCPSVVTWNGTGGTNGYTLQVYNAVPGGAMLFNGPVAAAGQMSFNCAGDLVPVVGLVRFNTNTTSGTVSDTA